MTDEEKKLVENLREHSEWAHANEWETPIMLGDVLDAAADMIEGLSEALVEIGSACAKARESMNREWKHLIDLRFADENDEQREEL